MVWKKTGNVACFNISTFFDTFVSIETLCVSNTASSRWTVMLVSSLRGQRWSPVVIPAVMVATLLITVCARRRNPTINARQSAVRSSPVRYGPDRCGPVRFDPVRSSPVRSSPVQYGRKHVHVQSCDRSCAICRRRRPFVRRCHYRAGWRYYEPLPYITWQQCWAAGPQAECFVGGLYTLWCWRPPRKADTKTGVE